MNLSIGNILLFCFASIGFCHIMVDGVIFEPLREWLIKQTSDTAKILSKEWWYGKISYVFSCYQCGGMYTGLFCGYFIIVNPLNVHWVIAIVLTFICGTASSFLSNLAAIYLTYLESQTK